METTTKRKPIRGFLYGIFLGLGLALIAVGQGFAALGTYPPFLLLILGIVAGTAWSMFGPAKAPKGPPPAQAEIVDEPASASEPEPVAAEPMAADEAPSDGGDAGGDGGGD